MKTPILLTIFNRPSTTEKVFDAIKQYRPTKLFIAADGPRRNKPQDKKKCEEARKVTEKIDWPCEVKRLYRNNNLGCKLAVSGAINWFFKNVEEGIILEDDCLPDVTFFNYCSVLLERFRNNSKIMHIGGNNFQNGVARGDGSYYFSKYPHIWGWATWRRAWQKYSVNINGWRTIKSTNIFIGMGYLEKLYWKGQFYSVDKNLLNTWDYQWVYAIWKNFGVCINPNKNLVINIGIGGDSTHTEKANKLIKSAKLEQINKIIHPETISIDTKADLYTLQNVFEVSLKNLWKVLVTIPYRIYKNL